MSTPPERHAAALLRRHGIHDVASVELEDLALAENLLVVSRALVDCQAALMCGESGGLVLLSDGLPFEGQRRFALAHEIGHWTLHRGLDQTFTDDDATLADYRKSASEAQANAFASALLLPDSVARPLAREMSMTVVLAAARRMRVGPLAAARRLVGLSPRPCAMVVARAGVSRYFVRDRDSLWPGFPAHHALPHAEARFEARLSERGSIEEAGDWWPTLSGPVRVQMTPITGTADHLILLTPC